MYAAFSLSRTWIWLFVYFDKNNIKQQIPCLSKSALSNSSQHTALIHGEKGSQTEFSHDKILCEDHVFDHFQCKKWKSTATTNCSGLPISHVCNQCMSDIITESSYHAAARHQQWSSTIAPLQLTFPWAWCHRVGAVTALLSQLWKRRYQLASLNMKDPAVSGQLLKWIVKLQGKKVESVTRVWFLLLILKVLNSNKERRTRHDKRSSTIGCKRTEGGQGRSIRDNGSQGQIFWMQEGSGDDKRYKCCRHLEEKKKDLNQRRWPDREQRRLTRR